MSIGISKNQMEVAGQIIQYNNEVREVLKSIVEPFEKMNNHSKSIIKFEGELSFEGLQESGRIQGRLDMIKLISEKFGIDIVGGL